MKKALSFSDKFILMLIVFLFFTAPNSIAQTDYSLRIRSLGLEFAGLIDDELTDVYLNPARIGIVQKRTLQASNLLRRSKKIMFPGSGNIHSWYNPRLSLDETSIYDFTYYPIVIGYLAPLRGGVKASFGFEVYLSDSDDLDSSSDNYYSDSYGGYIRETKEDISRNRNLKHLLLDVAVSSPKSSGYLGLRARVEHNESNWKFFQSNDRLRTLINPPYEVEEDYDYVENVREYEETKYTLAFGTYRPESVVRDLVVGFSGARYLFPNRTSAMRFMDDDADNNGTGFPSGNWRLDVSRSYYDSNREYRELGTFARVHLRLGKNWRTVHSIGFSRGEGDGSAVFETLKQYRDQYTYNHLSSNLNFDYDGNIASFSATTGIGRVEEVRENMVFAWGVIVSYFKKEFDEMGEGGVGIRVFGDDYPDSLAQNGDYSKEYNSIEESYKGAFLFALEWEISDFFVLRLGGYLGTRHYKNNVEYYQNVVLASPAGAYSYPPGDVFDYNVDYDTLVRLTNGIEINIKDRVKLDLHMHYGSFKFADYDHIELRYLF